MFTKVFLEYCKHKKLFKKGLKILSGPARGKFMKCNPNDESIGPEGSANVINMMYAFGVEWVNWQRNWAPFNVKDLLDSSKTEAIIKKYNNESAVWMHLYNSETKGWFNNLESTDTAAARIFARNCPLTCC